MTKKTKKKKAGGNRILIVAIAAVVVFGGVFAYFAVDYFLWWRDGQAAHESTRMAVEAFYEQMTDINELIVAGMGQGTLPFGDEHIPEGVGEGVTVMAMTFDAAPLERERERTGNPDIVGFLYIEGTNVNNVVVQGPDNAFYLNRDASRNWNVNGALFLDYRNSPLFNDKNTIIYGHNMNNGTMFHNLRYYMQRDFFEAHPLITLITDDHVFVYEIFSVFHAHISFDYIQVDFESREEFGALVEEIMRRRVYDTGIVADAYDNMLILSTCTNINPDTRLVVAARLAKIVVIQ